MLSTFSGKKITPDSDPVSASRTDEIFHMSAADMPDTTNHSVEFNVKAIRNISTAPIMKPNANAKQRINILEDATTTQSKVNEYTADALTQISVNAANREQELRNIINDIKEAYTKEILALRKEFDHRFDLQRAENKRLEDSLLLLRNESNETTRKLNLTIEQLRNLQVEFGGHDETDDFGLLATSVIKNKSS